MLFVFVAARVQHPAKICGISAPRAECVNPGFMVFGMIINGFSCW